MKNLYKKFINVISSGSLYLLSMMNVYAEDILADPLKNAFETFKNTGINVLLLIEICCAAFLYSSGQARTLKTFVGLPLIIAVTTYAKVKFGG